MRTRRVCLLLFSVAVAPLLLAVPAAAGADGPRCGRVDPAALFFPDGPEGWLPVDDSLPRPASGFVPERILPLIFFGDDGRLNLTRVGVGAGAFKEGEFELEGGACNGGQCSAAGTPLNCPTSGGPTCTSTETCHCICESGGGQTTTHNECR